MSVLCRCHSAFNVFLGFVRQSNANCRFHHKIIRTRTLQFQPQLSGQVAKQKGKELNLITKSELHWANRTMATSSSKTETNQNELALEKSPYLLQHASNPVHWYPWGDKAIEKARRENKPIFLSVGYSTCHWCHVMERESFESQEIGDILNHSFVSIKVDREERPDVDKVYMAFVQATTGSGGWPMSVWLTPDLRPIFGGTYFPPDDRYYGRPGFKTILLRIAEKWGSSRAEIEAQGTVILDALIQGTRVTESAQVQMPTLQAAHNLCDSLSRSYDERFGGFGKAPKFPQPVNFNALFQLYSTERETERGHLSRDMCLHTLRSMAKGGMHDHISQGFHRYSTDQEWHVPHFEKMLYDQGQLAVSYLDAYQITKEDYFAEIARDIFTYVNRDLSHPEGGFYSAEDADSLPTADSREKKEGAFCVWGWEELQRLLADRVGGEGGPTMADVFCHHYDCRQEGNVDPMQDPHEELKGQNVLRVKGSLQETATNFSLPADAVETTLRKCRTILYDTRQHRPRPHLDHKIVTAWNGLMISGLARGGQVLGDPALTQRAERAAEFVQRHLYNAQDHTLLRSCYTLPEGGVAQGSHPIAGFVDDYAFLIRGLLDLYTASLDQRWLRWSQDLQLAQDALFWDQQGAGYYNSQQGDPSIVIRLKDDQDGAEPSPNSVSCMNLLRLSSLLDKPEMASKAERILKLFAKRLNTIPMAVPELVCALVYHIHTPKQLVIVGSAQAEDTKAMLEAVHWRFLPNKTLILLDGSEQCFLRDTVPFLQSLTQKDGKATAYVCERFTCSAPTNSLKQLEKQLDSC